MAVRLGAEPHPTLPAQIDPKLPDAKGNASGGFVDANRPEQVISVTGWPATIASVMAPSAYNYPKYHWCLRLLWVPIFYGVFACICLP